MPHNIQSTGAFCLLLPGKNLHLSTLLAQKKFRQRGNKDGALNAFRALESAGLGKLKTEEKDRGTAEVSLLYRGSPQIEHSSTYYCL